jgi:ABC-type lipoprotein export system ATPase subunit
MSRPAEIIHDVSVSAIQVGEKSTMPESALELANVVKTYGEGSVSVPVLKEISANVNDGERIALLGKSGSGKSTLLNLLGGLDRTTSGSISVFGSRLDDLTSREMAKYRLNSVGIIFQGYNQLPMKSARENVELPLIFGGKTAKERRAAAEQALDAVGLSDRLDHKPTELSGGEQQRVAIARALVNKPRLLLADEPTGNLDSATAEEVLDVISSYVTEHSITVVLVTHDDDLADRFPDRVLRILDGRFVDDNSVAPSETTSNAEDDHP